jgi:hypothetical protein
MRSSSIHLNALLVALINDAPQVLTLQDGALGRSARPIRGAMSSQLYTFAHRNRAAAGSGWCAEVDHGLWDQTARGA